MNARYAKLICYFPPSVRNLLPKTWILLQKSPDARGIRANKRCMRFPADATGVLYTQLQYSRIGLSTSSACRSAGVGAIRGMKSTSLPSSGMCDFMFG